jgi:protein O-GlcNAc transferase
MTVETLTRPEADKDADRQAAEGMASLAAGNAEAARIALLTAIAGGDVSPATRLNLALAEERLGRADRARKAMRVLMERLPGWDEPAVRLAESLRAVGRNAEAEEAYRHALEINPRRIEALLALGGLLILRGAGQEARDRLICCCGIAPDRAETWHALGLALLQTREPSQALAAFMEAQRCEPASLEYALHGVEAALAAGEADAELARLTAGCDDDPCNPVLQVSRGALLERLGFRAKAIDALEAAAALAPDAPEPSAFLGRALARSSRLKEAERRLRRAAELDPDNAQVRNDHATVLMRMHRHAEARTLLLAVIAQHGPNATVLCNLANATACLGFQREAVDLARQAIELDPHAALPRRALCNTLPYLDGVAGATLLAALRDCAARLPRSAVELPSNSREADRRLTVGLLSGTLKTHPVGWLTVAGFETLDPEAFRLVCLAPDFTPGDPIAQRFRAMSEEWIDTDGLDDPALAAKAREVGIDILIDLGGYGDAGRMPACAHRLAPVQIKWVGMQNHSTGLPEMDWFVTDRWETPPELEHLYSERLLRLPDGYVCYSPPAYAPDVGPLPAFMNGHITFGCFNNLAKVTPAVIAAWARILCRVPDARLVLKTHQFSDGPTAEHMREAFAEHGVDAARLDLRGPSAHRAFMAEYGQIDIVLDPFPYSGGLTTCEALWMGVPTVTLPGETFAARHSVSHLSNAGLSGWVAADLDDYERMAVAKAGDRPGLARLRAGLREQVKASPLCDAPRFGRNLGAALRSAWRDWCCRTI